MSPRVPAVAAALGLAILLSVAGPVGAHVGLESSDPAAGSTVAGAGTVTLVFTEALKEGASSFKLAGPGGQSVGAGGVVGPRRMALDGLGDLPAGTYTVRWTATGKDGHVERGTFTFIVAATATETPAGPAPASPDLATDGPAATTAPGATDAADTTASPGAPAGTPAASGSNPDPGNAAETTSSGDILIPIVGGLAIVAVVGILVLRRSRRP